MSVKSLLEKRADIIQRAQLWNTERANSDGLLSAEDQAAFDTMLDDAQRCADQVKQLQRLESLQEKADKVAEPFFGSSKNDKPTKTIQVRKGTANGQPMYLDVPVGKRGSDEYHADFVSALTGNKAAIERLAALQSDDADQAGYLVASEVFASELLKAVDDLLFIRRYSTIHTVRDANSIGIRKRTAAASTFGWSQELSLSTEDSTLAYGKKVLTPHHLSGVIKVSRDLARRSIMSIDEIVREEMSRDAGEAMEDAYLTGTGAQQPLGVFTASSDGISTSRDSLTGSSTGFTADGLVLAKYQLKGQYRMSTGSRGGARWLFHRDAIRRIAQLQDAEDHYLLRPGRGLNDQDPDMLLGFPVDESERAPNTFTTGLYVGLLGNWRYYEIADSLDLELQVVTELYAATNQFGYIGRLKTDGMPTLEEAFVRLKTN